MGGRDVRTVADGRGGYFPGERLPLEPGVDGACYELGSFFGGTMPDAGEGDEFRVVQVAAELGRGADGDGAVAVSPED